MSVKTNIPAVLAIAAVLSGNQIASGAPRQDLQLPTPAPNLRPATDCSERYGLGQSVADLVIPQNNLERELISQVLDTGKYSPDALRYVPEKARFERIPKPDHLTLTEAELIGLWYAERPEAGTQVLYGSEMSSYKPGGQAAEDANERIAVAYGLASTKAGGAIGPWILARVVMNRHNDDVYEVRAGAPPFSLARDLMLLARARGLGRAQCGLKDNWSDRRGKAQTKAVAAATDAQLAKIAADFGPGGKREHELDELAKLKPRTSIYQGEPRWLQVLAAATTGVVAYAAMQSPTISAPAPAYGPPAPNPIKSSSSDPMIAAADRNGDGALDSSEWARTGAPAANFARADANGDGRVTAVELASFRSAAAAPPACPATTPGCPGSPGYIAAQARAQEAGRTQRQASAAASVQPPPQTQLPDARSRALSSEQASRCIGRDKQGLYGGFWTNSCGYAVNFSFCTVGSGDSWECGRAGKWEQGLESIRANGRAPAVVKKSAEARIFACAAPQYPYGVEGNGARYGCH